MTLKRDGRVESLVAYYIAALLAIMESIELPIHVNPSITNLKTKRSAFLLQFTEHIIDIPIEYANLHGIVPATTALIEILTSKNESRSALP